MPVATDTSERVDRDVQVALAIHQYLAGLQSRAHARFDEVVQFGSHLSGKEIRMPDDMQRPDHFVRARADGGQRGLGLVQLVARQPIRPRPG